MSFSNIPKGGGDEDACECECDQNKQVNWVGYECNYEELSVLNQDVFGGKKYGLF